MVPEIFRGEYGKVKGWHQEGGRRHIGFVPPEAKGLVRRKAGLDW